jgi:hypothetical protein
MTGGAKWSPHTRKVKDLDVRVQRLQTYERWAHCQPLDIEGLVDSELWNGYYALQHDILKKMREAQILALKLSSQVEKALREAASASSLSPNARVNWNKGQRESLINISVAKNERVQRDSSNVN